MVEVKSADADLDALIASEQHDTHWQARKLVLVTNLPDVAPVGQDSGGAMATLEWYSLAGSVPSFDELLQHTTRAANRQGVSLAEYLLRVMSHRSIISEPRDLARLLASYACDALQRIEQEEEEEDSLATIREAIEQALGMSFESEDGGRFFRSTLVQSPSYGAFAAWALWARADKPGRFTWKDTVYELREPVLRMLCPLDHRPRPVGAAQAGRDARLDRDGPRTRRPSGVSQAPFGGRSSAMLLRALP